MRRDRDTVSTVSGEACLSQERKKQVRQQRQDESWEEAGEAGRWASDGGRRNPRPGEEVWFVSGSYGIKATGVEPSDAGYGKRDRRKVSSFTGSSRQEVPSLVTLLWTRRQGDGFRAHPCPPETHFKDPR